MIRYNGLKINIDHSDADIINALNKKIRMKNIHVENFVVHKKSIDARDKKNIHWNYVVDFTTNNDREVLARNRGKKEFLRAEREPYRLPLSGGTIYDPSYEGRICVVGSGPAGLFCSYMLAKCGFRPLLIERGECVEERIKSVNAFWNDSDKLNVNSNVQFGEGGAGTFSDGKLFTGVRDKAGRNEMMLSIFVESGAGEEIMYDNKAHLGTDVLAEIVSNMRKKIIENGGEVLFNTQFIGFKEEKGLLSSIDVKNLKDGTETTIPCRNLVLAIGHSARDSFKYLISETDIRIEAKPFAVGLRIQHLQDEINKAQYGEDYKERYKDMLPPADYKLVTHTKDNEAIYSFCMCPGGYVINSSSEHGRLSINGMSYSGRGSENANSAIVISVKPSDDPLENIRFQQSLEEKAYGLGEGFIPIQRFEDFENKKSSSGCGTVKPCMKGGYRWADLNEIFDDHTSAEIKRAIHEFAKKIRGYDDGDALVSAIESRTSSPVRIVRDESFESNIKGIFPCGEGAGYAGGISSAAIDGIKVFEEIYRRYKLPQPE